MALFQTGDLESTTTDIWQVAFSDQSWLLYALIGALALMGDPSNWEQVGNVDPETAASYALDLIDSLTFIL